MSESPARPDAAALRAEHDALADRLAARPSVDSARKGLLLAFFALIALGTSGALAWDHWGPQRPGEARVPMAGRPLLLSLALAVGLGLAAWAAVALVRARRLARGEAVLFRRLRELRGLLGLDG
jgi:hypothetical protein